jgi:hypothetical protein
VAVDAICLQQDRVSDELLDHSLKYPNSPPIRVFAELSDRIPYDAFQKSRGVMILSARLRKHAKPTDICDF